MSAEDIAGFRRIKDRLESTPNEKLETVLSLLLPKVIPIANDIDKHEAIMEIIYAVKERIKSVEVPLPILRLLELVSVDFQPKGSLIAIEFLDKCILSVDPSMHEQCIRIIVNNLIHLSPFTEESNALLSYFWRFLPSLSSNPSCMDAVKLAPPLVLNLIGDWLFDATLLQAATTRHAVGSVAQGLSPERMDRLTSRYHTWTLADIKSLKLDIIKSFSQQWLSSAHTMAILLSCLNSSNQDVKSEAVFKINGARSLFAIQDELNAAQTLHVLLQLCIRKSASTNLDIVPATSTESFNSSEEDTLTLASVGLDPLLPRIYTARPDLPNSLKIVILEFIIKEMTGHLRRHSELIFELVRSCVVPVSGSQFGSNNGTAVAEDSSINNPSAFSFRSLIMRLLSHLTAKISAEELVSNKTLLIHAVKTCLVSFIARGTRLSTEELSRSAMLRDSCYDTVAHITKATIFQSKNELDGSNPSKDFSGSTVFAVIAEHTLVEILFKMLDLEGNHTSVSLHSALGSLRESLVHFNAVRTGNNGSTSDLATQLKALLMETRKSSQRKVQTLTAQWMLALYSWDLVTMETMFLLAGQSQSQSTTRGSTNTAADDESVRRLVKQEFTSLSHRLQEDGCSTRHEPVRVECFQRLVQLIGSDIFSASSTSQLDTDSLFHRGHFYTLHSASVYMEAVVGMHLDSARATNSDLLNTWIDTQNSMYLQEFRSTPGLESIISSSLEGLAKLLMKHVGHKDAASSVENTRMIVTSVRYIRNVLFAFSTNGIRSVVRSQLASLLLNWLANFGKFGLQALSSALFIQQEISFCIAVSSYEGDMTSTALLIRSLLQPIPKTLLQPNATLSIDMLQHWDGNFITLCYLHKTLEFHQSSQSDSSVAPNYKLLTESLISIMRNVTAGVDLLTLTVDSALFLSHLVRGYEYVSSHQALYEAGTVDSVTHLDTISALRKSLQKTSHVDLAISIFSILLKSRSFVGGDLLHELASELRSFALSIKWWSSVNTFWSKDATVGDLFSFAELVVRFLCFDDPMSISSSDFASSLESKLRLISYATEKVSAREKSTTNVFLLVLVRESMSRWASLGAVQSMQTKMFEWIDLSLRNLLFKDLLVQDLSVMILGNIYQCVLSLSAGPDSEALKEIAAKVAHEVIVILCKDKRLSQPVGVAVAGEQTEATVAPEETVMEILAGQNEALNNDPLIRAASALASELGVQLVQRTDNIGTPAGNPQTNATGSSTSGSQNYGVFTSIAKLAKKAGCEYLLFALLPLLRKNFLLDNLDVNEDVVFIFSAFHDWHENDLYKIFKSYQAPVPAIVESELVDLFPKLVMARFEPITEIREVIRKLYDDLLPSEKNKLFLKTHERAVLEYLLTNLDVKKWQDRASAALALEYALPSMSWGCLQRHLGTLWDRGFTLMDDIYEGCRTAAMRFMKLLGEEVLAHCEYPAEVDTSEAKSTLTSSNSNSGSRPAVSVVEADETVSFLLDKLLSKGILSTCLEAKGFSFGLLISLVKSARGNLKAHQPRLISVMVECMSAFEPAMLQYMQFHTSRMNITDEALERTRLDISQQSPMQEALGTLLETLDRQNLREVLVDLRNQTVSGVGLATRVAAIQSLARLAEVYPDDVGSSCGIVCQSVAYMLLNSASNTSVTLLKAMFSGLGSLARVMSPEAVLDTIRLFLNQYQNLDRVSSSNWSDVCYVVSSCLSQILTRAGDKLTDSSTVEQLLVISFVGRYETLPTEQNKGMWESIWTEMLQVSTHGTQQIAVEKSLSSLLKFISKMLRNNSWSIRTQGLLALQDVIRMVDKSFLVTQAAPFSQCVDSMLQLITPGNIWTGQHQVLETLAILVSKCKDNLDYTSTSTQSVDANDDGCPSDSIPRELLQSPSLTLNPGNISLPAIGTSNLDKVAVNLISVHRIVQLVLRESVRGDAEYRLSAGKALVALPWETLATRNLSLFVSTLPALCSLLGATEEYLYIDRIKTQLQSQYTRLLTVEEPGSVDVQLTQSSNSTVTSVNVGSVNSRVVTSAASKAASQASYTKKPNAASLFGSRYGTAVTAKKTAVKRARITESRLAGSVAVAAADGAQADDGEGKQSESTAPESSEPSSESVQTAENAIAASEIPSVESSDTTPAIAATASDNTSASNASKESGTVDSTELVNTSIKLNDPAFRMKVAECISQGWSRIGGADAAPFPAELESFRSTLLHWCVYALQNEVWSLKKAALDLCAKLFRESTEDVRHWQAYQAARSGLGDEDDRKKLEAWNCELIAIEAAILQAIITCSADTKHSPLRAQAFDCLFQLCRNTLLQINSGTSNNSGRLASFLTCYRNCIDVLLQTSTSASTHTQSDSPVVSKLIRYYGTCHEGFTEPSSDVLMKQATAKEAWAELKSKLPVETFNH